MNLFLGFDLPPFRLSGTIIGTLLNHAPALAAMGDAVRHPPYKARPRAPVLYIKPRNTWAGHGDLVRVPAAVEALEIGATLGIVIGQTACRLREADALQSVAGYTVVNDVSVPHTTFYRPSLRFKACDGFCPIGPRVVTRDSIDKPDALRVRVWIDGMLAQTSSTADRIRSVARLLAEVTDFMTLRPGDVLLLGAAAGAPRAKAGQQVAIEIDGIGRLENHLVAEAA